MLLASNRFEKIELLELFKKGHIMHLKHFVKTLLCVFSLSISSMYGTANSSPQGAREKISRPLTKKEKRTFCKALAKDVNIEKDQKNAHGFQEKGFYYQKPLYKPVLKTFFFHKVKTDSVDGNIIEIENGAIFQIKDSEKVTASQWKAGTKLLLCPNNRWFSWFSSYKYLLKNLETDTSVACNLIAAPYKNSHLVRRIVQVFPGGYLQLSDNSYWKVENTRYAYKHVNTWQEGDMVFFGNDSSSYENNPYWAIMINVATNSFLKVQRKIY